MSCQACRQQHAEDARAVPCDTLGLDGCPYWRTHGISPGVLTPLPVVSLALEVWHRWQALGWEAVASWLPVELTAAEAETVLEVLYELRCDQEEQRRQWEAEPQRWQPQREPRRG